MDDDLWRYVIEFILRQPINDDLLIGAISAMATRRDDPRLLRTLVLRALQSAAKASDWISETVLDNLEIVEDMDRKAGTEISDSMKVAYCAVAVWCTVKHLGSEEGADGEYFLAFRRIWKGKVLKLEGKSDLISEELGNWGDEINGALFDDDKWRGLVEKKRRIGELVLVAVNSYVEEAWTVMGPPFLKSVANELVAMEDTRGGSDQLVNYSRELVSDGGVGLAAETAGENVGEMLKMLRSEYDASRSGMTPQTTVTDPLRDPSPTPKRKRNDSIDCDLEITPISKRRTVRRWTTMEEEALRSGVRTHGKGNWKQILSHNLEIFEGRTEVDLKDKWRNLMR